MTSEFFDQGDLEKSKLKITPPALMDRDRKHELPLLQMRWIKDICLPLFEVFLIAPSYSKKEKTRLHTLKSKHANLICLVILNQSCAKSRFCCLSYDNANVLMFPLNVLVMLICLFVLCTWWFHCSSSIDRILLHTGEW